MGERRSRRTLAVALLLAAGCTTDGSRDKQRGGDPLLGLGGSPSGNQPVAVATATGVTPTPPAYKPQPPITAATPTSNAALAGGFQPLQGGNDLRIGNGPPTGGVALQQPQFTDPRAGGPTPATPTGFSPVTPVPPPGAPVNNPPPSPPMAGPGGQLDQAYAAVAAQNPLGHDMKFNSQTGEYTFHLIVPSKLNTSAARHVEASAQSPTDAIRRALEQLNN
jgi:hypothetical protein